MNYVLMDIGGTQIKAQVYCKSSLIPGGITVFDAKSGCDKNEIFDHFAKIISSLLLKVPEGEQQPCGIGMAFPGPFDYEQGVSLMRGLGKYDAIYGYSIQQEIIKLLPQLLTADTPFVFLHDVEAFAIGEIRFGEATNSHRAIHLCIGTGAGSAFTEDGLVLKEPTEVIPANGWIYNTAYRESIIDDYVSVRGLAKISGRFFENTPDGAALSELCNQGDPRALKVFSEFGKDVCAALAPFLKSFNPDTLVLGGQISKSFCYFGETLAGLCDELDIKIVISLDTSEKILKGLLSVLTGA